MAGANQEHRNLLIHLRGVGAHSVRTIVTAAPDVARNWIGTTVYRFNQNGRGHFVVGLGVQWRPGGNRGAATIQLCVGHRCLIFQLHRAERCPDYLRQFLIQTGVVFVGLWNYSHEAMLRESRHELNMNRPVDLREVASVLRGYNRNSSVADLALEILGFHGLEEEDVERSDWEAEELTMDQVTYACRRAFYAYSMARQLHIWN